jgi:broad specificity phosphatase PhoE
MQNAVHPPSQTVWICRHGNRIDFVDPTWREVNGHDPHLSEDGVRQAQQTGNRLVGEDIRYVFSSPFLRAVETAYHIASALDLPVYVERGASEWLNPAWFDGMPPLIPPQALARRFPLVDPHYESVLTPQYPETAQVASARAGETSQLLAAHYRGNMVIVGHGHSVQGMSWGLLPDRPSISTGLCALVKIERQESGWRLALNGDTGHLSDGLQDPDRFHP